MDLADAERFSQDWVDSWNTHDLDRIMTHYADDVVFTSPVAAQLLGGDGVVRGADALRAYWAEGLRRFPDLRFEVTGVHAGVDAVVIAYTNQVGQAVCEVLVFRDGLVVSGMGTYGPRPA